MDFLNNLSGSELVSFAALFSIALSQGLTSSEMMKVSKRENLLVFSFNI